MAKPYSEESVMRAITHHEKTGAIRSYSPPVPGGRRTHRIISSDGMDIECRTLESLYALVWGIRCGQVSRENGES